MFRVLGLRVWGLSGFVGFARALHKGSRRVLLVVGISQDYDLLAVNSTFQLLGFLQGSRV